MTSDPLNGRRTVAAAASGQSVGKALAGGLGPGVLLAASLACYNYYISRRRGYGLQTRYGVSEQVRALLRAVPSLGAPVIILTGMFSGIVTSTEAAGIAVVYTLAIGALVHRDLDIREVPAIVIRAARTSGTVLLILMVASSATYIFTVDLLPNKVSGSITALTDSPGAILLMMGVIFLVVGMLMDIVAAALMLIPVLLPAAVQAGIDPLHFVIFMAVGLAIGLATPPVGTCLFATAYVSKVPFERLAVAAIPFYVINIVVMILVAFVPQIVLWPADWLT
ncbi:MAG TPA: TRAP transporter large permease [Aurantimonas coralicida]|nr:TRAP transporter large permease [Aurantimonas coralicida]